MGLSLSIADDGLLHPYATGDALAAVQEERIAQDEKWGEQSHTAFEWLAILGEEVGEANQAALHAYLPDQTGEVHDFAEELVQVAAVATEIVEHIDRGTIA